MHLVLFGSSGMVGQAVLREALASPAVTRVTTVVRTPTAQRSPKLQELAVPDLAELGGLDLRCDACVFAIGVGSTGLDEAVLSPHTTFIYISGAGADGSAMWARVKRRAEQALAAMPFKASYAVRPAFIQPMDGIASRTRLYNTLYAALKPFTGLIPARYRTTTRELGRAVLSVAKDGYTKPILEMVDIHAAAARVGPESP